MSSNGLPEGWKECRIEDIATICVGQDLKEESYSEHRTNRHFYPIYSNSVADYGLYGYYDFEEYPSNCLTVVGRGVGLGTSFPRDHGFGAIGRLLVIRPKNGSFDVRYLSEYINTKLIIFNESSGIPQLPGASFAKYKVILPSFKEQVFIANILESWDTAIEKTQRLIAAKEQQFAWLATRLINNSNGGWSASFLNEIATIKKGQQLNRDTLEDSGNYAVWNGGITPSGYTDKYNINANTITISEGGNSCGFVNFCTEQFWLGGHCYAVTDLLKTINAKFLYHFLKARQKNIMRLRVGSGLPNIQKKDIDKFEIKTPPLAKQKRIANILNTAKQEINLLTKQVEQYRIQKRGLMQKLLTGKWQVKT